MFSGSKALLQSRNTENTTLNMPPSHTFNSFLLDTGHVNSVL